MPNLSDSWVKVFSSGQLYLAEIVKGVLEENEVPVILLNKQASIYNMFGEIEVYVPETESLKAYYLINQNQL
jgi:hypothetical protein